MWKTPSGGLRCILPFGVRGAANETESSTVEAQLNRRWMPSPSGVKPENPWWSPWPRCHSLWHDRDLDWFGVHDDFHGAQDHNSSQVLAWYGGRVDDVAATMATNMICNPWPTSWDDDAEQFCAIAMQTANGYGRYSSFGTEGRLQPGRRQEQEKGSADHAYP